MAFEPETLPWYKSRIIVGALVSAVLKVLFLTGLAGEVAPHEAAEWVDVAVLLASFVGDALVARGRIAQTVAPTITLTRKDNDFA